jgi:hypothetical protein
MWSVRQPPKHACILSMWPKNVYNCLYIYLLALADERRLLTWQQMPTAYTYTTVQHFHERPHAGICGSSLNNISGVQSAG